MNATMKKLVCICAAAALVASLAHRASAKKPRPEPSPDFTIKTSEWNNGFDPWNPNWTGYYTYSGVPHPNQGWSEDHGRTLGVNTLTLTSFGCEGTAKVSFHDVVYQRLKKKDTTRRWTGRFVIYEATGDYAFLFGATGPASGAVDLWYSGRTVTLKGFLLD